MRKHMTIREYNSGDIIFREGQWGNTMCEILEGSVGIYVGYESGQEKLLAKLQVGELFGEMAVLESFPRSASVVVLSDKARIRMMTAKEVGDFFQEEPEQLERILEQLSQRLDQLYDDYEKVRDEILATKGGQDADTTVGGDLLTQVSRLLSLSLLHPPASEEESESIQSETVSGKYAERMKSYQAGQVIFQEGDAPRYLYYVAQGGVSLCQGYGSEREKLVSKIRAHEFFGQLGLVSGNPRRFTAVALQNDTRVHMISRDALAFMLRKFPSFGLLILRDFSSQLRILTGDYVRLCKELSERKKR